MTRSVHVADDLDEVRFDVVGPEVVEQPVTTGHRGGVHFSVTV